MAGQDKSYYSPVEASEILGKLSKVQKRKFKKICQYYSYDDRITWQDLYQEAFVRVMCGKRNFQKNIEVIPFLYQVVRSIASEYYEKDKKIESWERSMRKNRP